LSSRVEVVEGAAIAELEKMAGPIDMAYVDCVKEEYPRYLELLVPRLAERGVIVADNVMWRGHVARPDAAGARLRARKPSGHSIEALVNHPALRGLILPLGDGVAYAVKARGVKSKRESRRAPCGCSGCSRHRVVLGPMHRHGVPEGRPELSVATRRHARSSLRCSPGGSFWSSVGAGSSSAPPRTREGWPMRACSSPRSCCR
jgi:hypothetical protein